MPSAPKPQPVSPSSASERSGALALAHAAAGGDTAATTQLLRLLLPEMARVVRSVMGPYAADVDDALQQALVALIHALPSFRGDCAPAGYACRIAFRTALGVRKHALRSRLRHDSEQDAALLAAPDSPAGSSEAAQRMELLRNLLDAIPTEQAEALCMRTMLGWSLDEISQVSGAPLNTVRSRLRLAKEALRERIEKSPWLADALGVPP